ncbi:MAG: apolipoprotein N-acyltransferase [Candidatus Sumerlaeota bacterium]|nr:apolipoprotein N-acyltransferase [Candidatus Sumerlaeota bacterium]
MFGIVLLAAISAIYAGVFALGIGALQNKFPRWAIALVPAWWVTLESIRSSSELGFPFGVLSHTQWQNLSLIQIVSITGTGALSYLIVLCNYALARALFGMGWKNKVWRWAEAGACCAIILAIWNLAPLLSEPPSVETKQDSKIGVLMIQHNIAQMRKWTSYNLMEENQAEAYKMWDEDALETIKQTDQALARHEVSATSASTASTETERDPIRLIIWPETTIPDYFFNLHQRYTGMIEKKIDRWKLPIVMGSSRVVMGSDNRTKENYNTAYYFRSDDERSIQYYDKIHLVPCGEDFSYLRYIPFIEKLGLELGSFDRGKESKVFTLCGQSAESENKQPRFSIVICFESTMPYLFRQSVRNGAQFMIVITNDGWYGNSSGPAQHWIQSVFRAVETRRWVCRCANTGISCFISPSGKIIQASKLNEMANLFGNIWPEDQITFYVKHGPWFPWLCVLISAGGLFGCLVIRLIGAQAGARHKKNRDE